MLLKVDGVKSRVFVLQLTICIFLTCDQTIVRGPTPTQGLNGMQQINVTRSNSLRKESPPAMRKDYLGRMPPTVIETEMSTGRAPSAHGHPAGYLRNHNHGYLGPEPIGNVGPYPRGGDVGSWDSRDGPNVLRPSGHEPSSEFDRDRVARQSQGSKASTGHSHGHPNTHQHPNHVTTNGTSNGFGNPSTVNQQQPFRHPSSNQLSVDSTYPPPQQLAHSHSPGAYSGHQIPRGYSSHGSSAPTAMPQVPSGLSGGGSHIQQHSSQQQAQPQHPNAYPLQQVTQMSASSHHNSHVIGQKVSKVVILA